MTVLFPEATKAQGNISVTVAPSVADTSAPSLATDINAAGSVNVSCFLYDNGSIVSASTNKVTANPRLCTTEQFQQFGNTTYEVSDLSYVYDPQGVSSADPNKAKEALTEGAEVYLVERLGLDAQNTAYAAGQIVNIYHVRLGKQNRTRQGDAEAAEFSITQSAILLAPPVYDVAIVA
jgi:hypothetical protein